MHVLVIIQVLLIMHGWHGIHTYSFFFFFLLSFNILYIFAIVLQLCFFAKEALDSCDLIATKESLVKPVTVPFEKGLGQKLRQPCRTGIDMSMFEEAEFNQGG